MKSLFRMRSAALLAATVLGQALAPGALVSAAATAAPSPGSIEVQNRLAGTPDTVTVTGLAAGDTVKVYSDPVSAGDLLGSATVASGMTNAVVTVSQIGEEKGLLYVTVTRPSYSESRRILKTFPAEPESVPPATASIRMINNPAGTADRIYVSGLTPGDTAQVYTQREGGSPAGTAVVAAGGDTAEITVPQLGTSDGIAYVSVRTEGRRESRRTEKAYAAEAVTPAAAAESNQPDERRNLGGRPAGGDRRGSGRYRQGLHVRACTDSPDVGRGSGGPV
ncbi:hypothetical protein LJK87_31425 [Paenibacillus sp. P25]|nr:hypothetical protein LJK87_31425 [Paenibacillus sp. P25]